MLYKFAEAGITKVNYILWKVEYCEKLNFLFQNGDNLLHLAVDRKNVELFNLLLERTNIDPAEKNQVWVAVSARLTNIYLVVS